MRVCLYNGTLLQEDLSHHRAVAVDETALDLRGHALFRNAVPAVMRSLLHFGLPSERGNSIEAASAALHLRRLACVTWFAFRETCWSLYSRLMTTANVIATAARPAPGATPNAVHGAPAVAPMRKGTSAASAKRSGVYTHRVARQRVTQSTRHSAALVSTGRTPIHGSLPSSTPTVRTRNPDRTAANSGSEASR